MNERIAENVRRLLAGLAGTQAVAYRQEYLKLLATAPTDVLEATWQALLSTDAWHMPRVAELVGDAGEILDSDGNLTLARHIADLAGLPTLSETRHALLRALALLIARVSPAQRPSVARRVAAVVEANAGVDVATLLQSLVAPLGPSPSSASRDLALAVLNGHDPSPSDRGFSLRIVGALTRHMDIDDLAVVGNRAAALLRACSDDLERRRLSELHRAHLAGFAEPLFSTQQLLDRAVAGHDDDLRPLAAAAAVAPDAVIAAVGAVLPNLEDGPLGRVLGQVVEGLPANRRPDLERVVIDHARSLDAGNLGPVVAALKLIFHVEPGTRRALLRRAVSGAAPPDQFCHLLVEASTSRDLLIDIQEGIAAGQWQPWTAVARAAMGSLRISADDVAVILLHDDATPDALLAGVKAIGQRRFTRTDIVLRAAARVHDHPVTLAALLTLAASGSATDIDVVWPYTSHADERVVAAAVRAAGASVDLNDARVPQAADDPRPVVRAAVAQALAAIVERHLAATNAIADAMIALLTDHEHFVRACAVDTAEHLLFATPVIDDVLAALAADEDLGVSAVEALAYHADPRAVESALRWPDDVDDHWLVRVATLTRSARFVPALERALESLLPSHETCCAGDVDAALLECRGRKSTVPARASYYEIPVDDTWEDTIADLSDPNGEWTALRRDEERCLDAIAEAPSKIGPGVFGALLFLVRRHTRGYEGHDPAACRVDSVVERLLASYRAGDVPAAWAAHMVAAAAHPGTSTFAAHADPAVRYAASTAPRDTGATPAGGERLWT